MTTGQEPGLAAAEPAPIPRRERSLPALDGVRALAAVGVVVTHVTFRTGDYGAGLLGGVFARLDVAVAVFFVLSGFLLLRPWVAAAIAGDPRPRAAAYLWRRALRILPAYWALLVLTALLLPEAREGTGANWLRHVLLVHIYWEDWPLQGLTHTWSLCTEVAFYVLVPLLGALLLRSRSAGGALALAAGLVVLGIVSTAVAHGADAAPDSAGTWLPPHAGWFGGGLALAVASVRLSSSPDGAGWRAVRAVSAAPGSCWTAAAACLLLAATSVTGPRAPVALTAGQGVARELLFLAAAVLLVLPAALPARGPSLLLAVLSSPPLSRAGELSYGIFLYHLVVLEVVVVVLDVELFTGDPLALLAVVLPVTWVISALSWRFLEAPAMRLRDRVPSVPRRRRETAAAQP